MLFILLNLISFNIVPLKKKIPFYLMLNCKNLEGFIKKPHLNKFEPNILFFPVISSLRANCECTVLETSNVLYSWVLLVTKIICINAVKEYEI